MQHFFHDYELLGSGRCYDSNPIFFPDKRTKFAPELCLFHKQHIGNSFHPETRAKTKGISPELLLKKFALKHLVTIWFDHILEEVHPGTSCGR